MRQVIVENTFESWRIAARRLLVAKVSPDDVVWADPSQRTLFDTFEIGEPEKPTYKIDPAFIDLARLVSCHSSSEKWPLLYRLLYRLINENRELLEIASDIDVRDALLLKKSVTKDVHKFHAFVRFRSIKCDGREVYVAWYEPHHYTVERATPFFERRFGSMTFSILTPKGCAHWNLKKLTFSPGVEKINIADSDDTEDFWLTYYAAIFNPFRLKIKAMKKELPVRHWRTLPEAVLIDRLIKDSTGG